MLFPNLAAFATLLAITLATPTPLDDGNTDNGTSHTLTKYEVNCRSGGNTLPRCYESGSAGCRCSSIGVYNCQDDECKTYCGCSRYVLLNLQTPTVATR
ncbi:hypothetical protein COCCADRAFT_112396 [Bipolaris zeicola 26-R-13]|uniref:EGF-like calcium-binding domain-containing protein n=1 Tax=Cochliobolus carbonum (strain 26-R-13) TaxID=930089 RepID=W6XNW7_COCC2|nr:uncharacterized protein COCCADRAFT_112396 [Bipolaris zeicola 26-R-13]EUC27168.1 hypothetical protein COCCADRAFT_112396 [Bipolaris zeicola 26-R-13]